MPSTPWPGLETEHAANVCLDPLRAALRCIHIARCNPADERARDGSSRYAVGKTAEGNQIVAGRSKRDERAAVRVRRQLASINRRHRVDLWVSRRVIGSGDGLISRRTEQKDVLTAHALNE